MPPWHADPRYGHFVNDRSLIAKDRATLLAWVDQGTPLGDTKDLPPASHVSRGLVDRQARRRFRAARDLLRAGPGSRVLRLFPGADQLQGRPLGSGRRGRAGRPVGGPSHHRLRDSITAPGVRRRPQPMHFTGYAPGDAPSIFPEGTAKRIPAGADLLFQVHYTPNGRVRTDRSKVGLVFAKTKPDREAFTIGIANPDLLIPARPDNVAVASSFVLPERCAALELVAPHAPARQGLQVHDHQARRVASRSCSRSRPTTSAGRPITSSPNR